jgi:hypothetical protein
MKLIIISGLIAVSLLISGCTSGSNFDARLNPIVQPYRFSIAGWEWQVVVQQAKLWYWGRQTEIDDGARFVTEYFDAVKRIKTLQSEIAAANAKSEGSAPFQLEYELGSLQEKQILQASIVEKVIEGQVKETLARQGIFNPIAKGKVSFPPLNFKLEELPSLLVISPRDRIESMREIVLNQNLTLKDQESIEAGVDKLGVSSLVVGVGGIATYPTLVDSEASLQSVIETAAHEWLHQYLAFTPLGFRYVLDVTGLSRNYEIATMNESLADMVGKEIGALVYEKYYSEYDNEAEQTAKPKFDFNLEMREIRKAVDVYLARGGIGQAETFMEQKRQELVSKGYYIRKLNQAYFAFHGTYADSPAFVSPIGQELKELRSKSASLKGFLKTVAGMTSRQDLTESHR